MVKITRTLAQELRQKLFQQKVIVLYGARQVGKTTLIKALAAEYGAQALYLNADEPDIRANLTEQNSTALAALIGAKKLILIDEAQRIPNIGITLKLLVDSFPQRQFIATGSSSFELSNRIVEPLTGRKYELQLYALSGIELQQHLGDLEFKRQLEKCLIFGMYPEIVTHQGPETKERLISLANSYLYKDIFALEAFKRPERFEKLVQALALQIGQEVSYNELGSLAGIDKNTVARYIQLLEQAFIVFRLRPFSRNLRNELKKMRKIYFYDNGIRNAVINNFNPLTLRMDQGVLWENFLLSERLKRNQAQHHFCNPYFWRTHAQQEIDYLEESDGQLKGFEFKWRPQRYKTPLTFTKAYPKAPVKLIHQNNYGEFIFPDPET